jgi:hypothetical protein
MAELADGLTPGGALQVERAWQLLARLAPDGGEALAHPRRVAQCMRVRGVDDGGALAGALLHDAYEGGVVALAEIRACAGPTAADVAVELADPAAEATTIASRAARECHAADRAPDSQRPAVSS